MIPREPPRRPQLGFLFIPPYPELDVCFDIGSCPKAALASNYVALTHGHMDHAAALSYYFSQRNFQGMGTGTLLCHPDLEQPIHNIMNAWVGVENQRTPYNVIAMSPDAELEIKNNIVLRAFETYHTVPSLGFVAVEKRSKLRPEFVGLEQEQLKKLKQEGTEITHTLDIPLVCYTGDTAWGDHFDRPDVLGAQILITECTFLEPGHRGRANIGKHLHLDHIVDLLEKSTAEAVVLTHLSRRTHINEVRRALDAGIPTAHRERVLVLMDGRENRRRYEQQAAEAEAVQG